MITSAAALVARARPATRSDWSWEGVLALYEYLDIKESEVGNLGSEIELTNGSLRTPSL